MKKFLYLFVALAIVACSKKANPETTSQETESVSESTSMQVTAVNMEITAEDGRKKLLGPVTQSGLQKEPYNEWFSNKAKYNADAESIEALKKAVKAVKFKAFFGTWCGDSKAHMPELYSVLDAAGVKDGNVEVIAVDNARSQYKRSPGGEERGLNIHRVPTVIAYKNGKEIGRIVESPKESIEKDLVKILLDKGYVENYFVVSELDALIQDKGTAYFEKNMESLVEKYQGKTASNRELNTYSYTKLFDNKRALGKLITQMNHHLYDELYTLEKMVTPMLVDGEFEAAETAIQKFEKGHPEENVSKLRKQMTQLKERASNN